MISEIVRVLIDETEQDDLVPDILGVDVEEHVDSANVFALRIALTVRRNGTWSHVDDDRFTLWRRVVVQAGYADAVQTLADGYVTHVDVMLGDGDEPYLEVSGMDASALMDLDDRRVAWRDKKDSEIASEILSSPRYGLTADVHDTTARHSTVLQTCSDIRFLRQLARRNGFECGVRGATGIFRAPQLSEPPQKQLALASGQQTNLVDLRISVDGTVASSAVVRRLDPVLKRQDSRTIDDTPRRALGRRTLAQLAGTGRVASHFVSGHAANSISELDGLLRAAVEGASRFVTAQGEIDSRVYRAVLRAGRLVTITGAGERYSGLYYVTRVRHAFNTIAYVQRFDAYRTALGATGEERTETLSALAPLATVFVEGDNR